MNLLKTISEMIKTRGSVVIFCGNGYHFKKITPINDSMVDDIIEALRYEYYEDPECRELYVAVRVNTQDIRH